LNICASAPAHKLPVATQQWLSECPVQQTTPVRERKKCLRKVFAILARSHS